MKVVAVYRVDDLVSDSRALLEAAFVEPAEIRISTGVDVMPEAQKAVVCRGKDQYAL